jgi:enoyl-CoA hydratase
MTGEDSDRRPVLTERRDGVLVITLNRPRARNAINLDVAQGIAAAIDELDRDDDVRAGVLTGAGGTFCSGMDLKSFSAGQRPHVEGRGFAGIVQAPPRKPLVAAIEGYALAGGLEIALACDLLVAASDAKLGIPEVKRGLVAAAGALIRLPRRIPHHVAMELALTGEFITGDRALSIGLLNRVTPPGRALEEAISMAAAIARNGPLAIAASKRMVLGAGEWTEAEAWRAQAAIVEPVLASEDAREGAVAFAEKRDPVWRGR